MHLKRDLSNCDFSFVHLSFLYLKRLGMSEKVSFLHVVPHIPYCPDF